MNQFIKQIFTYFSALLSYMLLHRNHAEKYVFCLLFLFI